jgi:hypothetical protein
MRRARARTSKADSVPSWATWGVILLDMEIPRRDTPERPLFSELFNVAAIRAKSPRSSACVLLR